MEPVITHPVGPTDVPAVAELFASQRNTRRCWCMAFCVTRTQFAWGWLGHGNRRRFETIAATSAAPMGILAYQGDQTVGWCACGPRSRYVSAGGLGSKIGGSDRQDGTTWFIPCLFVRPGYRDQGLTRVLIRAAVDLARREGASAIEGWPLAQAARRSADAFLGREQMFEELGFRCVEKPIAERVIMRLELSRS